MVKDNIVDCAGIQFYKCAASKPHRCLTYTWRFNAQAQFELEDTKEVVRCPAPSASVY